MKMKRLCIGKIITPRPIVCTWSFRHYLKIHSNKWPCWHAVVIVSKLKHATPPSVLITINYVISLALCCLFFFIPIHLFSTPTLFPAHLSSCYFIFSCPAGFVNSFFPSAFHSFSFRTQFKLFLPPVSLWQLHIVVMLMASCQQHCPHHHLFPPLFLPTCIQILVYHWTESRYLFLTELLFLCQSKKTKSLTLHS